MKRIQLIETGIIAIALIFLYYLIGALFELFTSFIFFASGSFQEKGKLFMFGIIFPVVLYFSAFYLLLRFKKPFARWINGKETEDAAGTLFISPNHLLHIVLFVLCFITIITELPGNIRILIRILTVKETYDVSDNDMIYEDNYDNIVFWGSIIRIGLAIVILIFSKRISAIWYKKPPAE